MKFGVLLYEGAITANPDVAIKVVQAAEEAGFESVWLADHVVIPVGYEPTYPFADDGRMPMAEDFPFPDPLILLSYMAQATRRINLGTGVLILPQRNPLILAKQTATLDLVSGGRLLLGIGLGWMKEEAEAIGVSFADRGRRANEYIAALRVLWSDEDPTFHGRFVEFERAKSSPKPSRPGGPPIIVAGQTEAAARRAGRLGDGFFPGAGGEKLAHLLEVMRLTAKEAGRDPLAVEVTAGLHPDFQRAAELGISRMIMPGLGHDFETFKRTFGDFHDQVISRLS